MQHGGHGANDLSRSGGDLLVVYDEAKLTPRYWASIGLLILHEMFDYFDFFVVGYLVAVLAPQWHLTYGQSTTILLAAGLGAIIGSLTLGKLADVVGRKPVMIASGLLVAASAGGIALIGESDWVTFSILRVVVGIGLGGAVSGQNALVVEFTPTRYRTFISSAMIAPVSLGILLAAILSSQVLPVIGWRGLAAIGAFPGLLALALVFVLPESTRWLLSRNRFEEARRAAALQLGVAAETLPLPTARPLTPPKAPLRELLAHPRAFWLIVITWLGMSTTTYGYQLWAPTILASAMSIPVKAVAGYFVIVGISGTIGRFLFSALPLVIGRRHSGEVMGWGAALFILLAGLQHDAHLFGAPAFIVWLTLAAVFVNGGFSNMAPYAAESYPVRLAARASGLAQAVNGVGKMLGPLVLGLIAGTGNVVNPAASESAVVPAFTFLAACSLLAGLAYRVLPIETHGRSLVLTAEELPAGAHPESTVPTSAGLSHEHR
jgi:putative MFS transporter